MSELDTEKIDHHVSPVGMYIGIFVLLMVLTAITVGIAYVDLGVLNTFVAVTIAVVKTCIVGWFFMHLSHSAKITWVCAAGGALWLIIMLALTLSDYLSRGMMPPPESWGP